MDKDSLEVKKKRLHNKLYMMMIEIIFIFGIPAVVGFFLGKFLDTTFGTGRTWSIIVLLFAFIISWIYLIARVRKIGKEIKMVEKELKTHNE